MSCITKQHIGKYTYLYESTSFRNAEGKPRNKKIRIGKIDPYTGKTIYTEDYLRRMEEAGTPVKQEALPPKDAGQAAVDSTKKAVDQAVDNTKKAAEDAANAAKEDAKKKANDAIDQGADKLKKGLGL